MFACYVFLFRDNALIRNIKEKETTKRQFCTEKKNPTKNGEMEREQREGDVRAAGEETKRPA